MTTILETERLRLRRFTLADEPLLTELDADPEVTRFITGGVPEFDAPMLRAWIDGYDREPGYGTLAAEERAGGTFLGWFHLRPDEADPAALELGYRVRRSAWGKGLATEGSRALVDRAFLQLGAQRVTAYALAVHAAARRVMEKSGLRYVRTFHADWPYAVPGDEHGDVEYAVTREEWQRGQSSSPNRTRRNVK